MRIVLRIVIGIILMSFIAKKTIAQTDEMYVIDEPAEIVTDSTVYGFVDTMPEFIGFIGENTNQRLEGFIKSNLQWPSQGDCTGRVYIEVIIEKDGTLTNPVIIKGINSCTGFNEEAIRVVKLLPKWKPGKSNGKPVRVKYMIRVKFDIPN